jgi:hypothetical protein
VRIPSGGGHLSEDIVMFNGIATTNQFATSDENSTGILLGSLTLIAWLLTIMIAMTNSAVADSIALLGMTM